jgi:ribosomal protein S18 acetylase RimI-like enzyme
MPKSSSKQFAPPYTIRLLGEDDVLPFRELRLHGLRSCPTAFGQTAEEFERVPANELSALFRTDESIVYGAFSTAVTMVGLAGLRRASRARLQHKAFVWGVYVRPEARGAGVGRLLIEHVIERARNLPELEQLHLTVSSTQTAAEALYRRLGFVCWGTEPRALKVGQEFVDEAHMLLNLR